MSITPRTAFVLAAALLAVLYIPVTSDAAFPGRNGRIAFTLGLNGSEADDRLWVIRPDGRRLKEVYGDGVDAAFSPSGRKLAYTKDYQYGIWVGRADGRGPARQVTTGLDLDPDWSPSGRRLVFERTDEDGSEDELWIKYPGGERLLTFGSQPAWSSTGWIAFVRGTNHIYLIRPDGTRLRSLVHGSSPDWSPDGRRLVLVTQRSYVATVRFDGSELRRLRRGLDPAFSPDGHKIVYVKGAKGLTIIGSRGKHPRRVPHAADADNTLSGEGGILTPDWQAVSAQ